MSTLAADVIFDDFGDFNIVNKDIQTSNNKLIIFRQNAIDRIKSNQGDYKLYPNVSANTDTLLGRQNGPTLEKEMERLIIRALTFDGFVSRGDINIVSVSTKNSILTKIEIATGIVGFSTTVIKINTIYNALTGTVNVY
jgi:hypothetical protein